MTEDLAYSVEGSKLPEEIHRGISIPNGKVVPVRDSLSRQNDLERESGRYPQDGAGLSSAPLGQSHLPIGWIYRKNPLAYPANRKILNSCGHGIYCRGICRLYNYSVAELNYLAKLR